MSRITLTIHLDVPDGVEVEVQQGIPAPRNPAAEWTGPFTDEPPHMAELPAPSGPVAAPVQAAGAVPQCQHHGPMTFHPAGPNKAGKQLSASYRCDQKIDGEFCPTKPKWL